MESYERRDPCGSATRIELAKALWFVVDPYGREAKADRTSSRLLHQKIL